MVGSVNQVFCHLPWSAILQSLKGPALRFGSCLRQPVLEDSSGSFLILLSMHYIAMVFPSLGGQKCVPPSLPCLLLPTVSLVLKWYEGLESDLILLTLPSRCKVLNRNNRENGECFLLLIIRKVIGR